MSNTAPILGSDNISPIYNPYNKWEVWNINEIYLGNNAQGKYVPKVNDLVCEIVGDLINWYVVKQLDNITYIPKLILQKTTIDTNELSEDDILYGTSPGIQSETYRCYLDTSVTPHRLAVDKRLKVPGSTTTACRIFKGSNLSSDGVIISGTYNQSGLLLSQNIPLELIYRSNNVSVKNVSTCYTTYKLNDGEVVTAVFYDSDGFVVFKKKLLIENTGFILGTESDIKYVSHISLDTPFLSSVKDKQIDYPINLPLNSINLIGVVYYNDGTNIRLPVDGTKFSIMGLDNYNNTILGERSELVLKYKLDKSESALDVHFGNDVFISDIYEIVTINSNGHYSVQLYPYLIWSNLTNSYSLKWYIIDLDRTNCSDVTSNVLLNNSFNPTAIGVKQTLNASINLRNINGNYNNYIHVQSVDIVLIKMGNSLPINNISNWSIANRSNQSKIYGSDIYAIYNKRTLSSWDIKINPTASSKIDWLNDLYYNTNPLFNPSIELKEIEPTHFVLLIDNLKIEYEINDYNKVITLNNSIVNYSTLFIKFIKKTNTNDLQLSIAGIQVFQVSDITKSNLFI